MSPGSPDGGGAKGPRRIGWDRLPGPGDGPDAPPPRRPPPDRNPRAGRSPDRVPRVGDGRTGSQPRVTGSYNRATGTHQQVTGSHPTGQRPPKKRRPAKKPEAESRLSQPHKRQYLSLWVELPLLLLVAFSAAVLLRTFAVQPFYIPSGSMEQTLQEGDKVLVLKLTTTLRTPQRGEVVVFRGSDRWDPEYRPAGGGGLLSDFGTAVLDLVGLAEPDEKDFIKRVIAVGGDTVVCCDADGKVVVNGISLEEQEYVYDDAPLDVEPGSCHSRRFDQVTIPAGHVWVMGDHRGNSQDSRCKGPVPVENIIGRAVALVWPTDRARDLEIPDSFSVLEGTTGGDGADSSDSEGDAEDSEDGVSDGAARDPFGLGVHEGLPAALPPAVLSGQGSRSPPRVGVPVAAARPRRLAP